MRSRRTRSVLAGLVTITFSACAGEHGPADRDDFPTRVEEAERVVAIGDLHGDLAATRAALRLAGAIDSFDLWVGEDLVVVQLGDALDRGDEEEAVFRLLEELSVQASSAGGAVHLLNGNHEMMNAYLDYRYVTDGGWADFEEASTVEVLDTLLAAFEPHQRARIRNFRPGGEFARILAKRNTFLIVGTTVFVHGGVLPANVDRGLEVMNDEARQWLRGETEMPEWVRGDDSPVWNRLYSDAPDLAACDTLEIVLEELEVDRMVVGHTIQSAGVTSYCGGRVWCIDVGMSGHYGGRPEVLEIRGDVVRSLR